MQKLILETDVGIDDYKKQKKIFNINYPNEGEYVALLENKVKKILKTKYCIALPLYQCIIYIFKNP